MSNFEHIGVAMALKDDIQNQTFQRCYLIYGQDDFLREKNAKKLRDAA